jgi:hypothetical protein
MLRLVEDVGEPLYAGWVSRFTRAFRTAGDSQWIGGRWLAWEWDGSDAVAVAHRPADRSGKSLRYAVRLTFTELPSGGLRLWWSCPACGGRVDALYLVRGRDRLACRRCCGLVYRSQYTTGKTRWRKRRPTITTRATGETRVWTPTTGWVIVSRRVSRRRPVAR